MHHLIFNRNRNIKLLEVYFKILVKVNLDYVRDVYKLSGDDFSYFLTF